ncbi:MAG: hypothetical protein IKD31_00080 [Clostridia bacterium]|nr:hypothetical protein [Clostridia bacterium]
MKRVLLRSFALCLVTLLLIGCSLIACSPNSSKTRVPPHPDDSEGLDPALASEIKLAYTEYMYRKYEDEEEKLRPTFKAEDLSIDYYGKYSGLPVFEIKGDGMDEIRILKKEQTVWIGDYVGLTKGKAVYVYWEGLFIHPMIAYGYGLLDGKDGQEIVTRIDPDAIPREEWDGTLK